MLKFSKMIAALALATMTVAHAAESPKYVIYMIGDGMGPAHRQVSEYYMQELKGDPGYRLAMNSMPVSGIITSHSASSLVTDSAAGGTALATGVKTTNGTIALTPDGKKLTSLITAAEKKGWATGIVSTTSITHATPAVFASNNESRGNETEIAVDFLDSGVDFFAGGGYRFFITGKESKRKDGRNLIKEFEAKGYTTFVGEASTSKFLQHQVKPEEKVLATFTPSHMPYSIDRNEGKTPSLAQMTAKGIELLSKDKDGFFLMVEGGRIDHASHANDIAGAVGDTIGFDNAVREALDFYHKHADETLIVIAADHETGGMGLGMGKQYFVNLHKITDFKESIGDKLSHLYQGDRKAFFKHIEEAYALTQLSQEELKAIEKAMDFVDSGKEDKQKAWGGYDPVAIAVAHVASKRAGIYWTSYAHTATQLPISAIGVGASQFGGFFDNTEVAKKLAKTINVKIGL